MGASHQTAITATKPTSARLGLLNGKHYTGYVEVVKDLKRRGEYSEVEELLLSLLDVIEAESHAKGWGVAPWYYEQLAIVYRSQGEYAKEVSVLERYARQHRAPGARPSKLDERLARARELVSLKGASQPRKQKVEARSQPSRTKRTVRPKGPSNSIEECTFSVFDVETTGLSPRMEKIVEIAIIRVRADGTVIDEYQTLVNPLRDVGPTWIHGITNDDVRHAPLFPEIAGDVAERLAGTVLVGHNVRFDLGFLRQEFQRIDSPLPEAIPSLCTMRLAGRYGLHPPEGKRLVHCCSHLGIPYQEGHIGLADAKATAALFQLCLSAARKNSEVTLGQLGCSAIPLSTSFMPTLPRCGRTLSRARSKADYRERPKMSATSAYTAILYDVLKDGILTLQEVQLLDRTARQFGLQDKERADLHQAFVQALVEYVLTDNIVTEEEARYVHFVAETLGVPLVLESTL
ncbi:MAG TPA: 3'-5' exonuclease [Acidobacteriota bacterium]|nr:3'-5' exonuclease [Acidobacteriota bacterium]